MKALPLLASLALAAGCNSTSGALIQNLPVQVGGIARDGGGPLVFTTAMGWQVQLEQAVFTAGPFYFYNAPPDTNGDQTGTCLVEVLQQSIVDALDPTLYDLDGGASGETGASDSVDVWLVPPGDSVGGPGAPGFGNQIGPNEIAQLNVFGNLITQSPAFSFESSPLFLSNAILDGPGQSACAFVAGVAQSPAGVPAATIPFYGFINNEYVGYDSSDPATSPSTNLEANTGALPCAGGYASDGGDCSLTFTTASSILQIRIDPTHLFDGVDFSTLLPADAGSTWSADAGPLTWSSTDVFNIEFVEQGLRSSEGVFLFGLAPLDGGE